MLVSVKSIQQSHRQAYSRYAPVANSPHASQVAGEGRQDEGPVMQATDP